MLVLSRRRTEKIMIGDGIEVTVLEVRGDRVTLGIEAPPDLRVLRGELVEASGAVPGANHDHQQKGEPTRSEST